MIGGEERRMLGKKLVKGMRAEQARSERLDHLERAVVRSGDILTGMKGSVSSCFDGNDLEPHDRWDYFFSELPSFFSSRGPIVS